ncbi:hypothetical protein DNL40_10105 [Xylanimonas oleitrophica]|uniref:DUF11 domain-containing protein n=1 Tax=Xylanimonas oleitrophica TaxID=2607479 RepID=A0A2W5WNH9_9MICO|nr:DUF11 domain-containing protein [Xylanimonas oleitrophica]PZR52720.1 hypothetical protein DNL40_10105 [Xylanimonas oleitrophica]
MTVTRHVRRALAAGGTLVLAALVAATPAAAVAAGASAPDGDVTVAVTPDRDQALSPGDEVVYTIEVTNHGEALDASRVVQLLPAGFEHVSADPEGTAGPTQTTWEVPLQADETVTIHHTVRAGTAEAVDSGRLVHVEQPDAPAGSAEQFSSTVCVYGPAGGDALGCSSAWQRLQQDGGVSPWVWAGAAAVPVAALGAYLWHRRRSQQRVLTPA